MYCWIAIVPITLFGRQKRGAVIILQVCYMQTGFENAIKLRSKFIETCYVASSIERDRTMSPGIFTAENFLHSKDKITTITRDLANLSTSNISPIVLHSLDVPSAPEAEFRRLCLSPWLRDIGLYDAGLADSLMRSHIRSTQWSIVTWMSGGHWQSRARQLSSRIDCATVPDSAISFDTRMLGRKSQCLWNNGRVKRQSSARSRCRVTIGTLEPF